MDSFVSETNEDASMGQDLSLEEQIDLMTASIQRNVLVTVLLSSATFLLQGIVIALFGFLFERQMVSIGVVLFGAVVFVIGVYSLVSNFRRAASALFMMSELKEDLPEPSEDSAQESDE